MATVAGERKIVTVLFADLVEFTPLVDYLDPEDVATIQSEYLQAAREVVKRYGGRLEKFIGDAIMAVFGSPVAGDDDAVRAVRAGLALTAEVEEIGTRLGLLEAQLRVRVGINTGHVLETAEPRPDSGLVTGDAVNVAARLQAAAEPGEVLIGGLTALAVAGAVELTEQRLIRLKGKPRPVRVARAVSVASEPSREQALGHLHAPLVGRERELSRLHEGLAGVSDGGSARWVVVALPGIGKTRLVNEFAAAVPGTRVLRARTRPHALAPYDVVGELFRAAVAEVGDADAVAAVLRDRLADAGVARGRADAIIDSALPLAFPLERHDAGSDREVLHAGWIAAFEALSAGQPTVWVVEDLHWASGDLLAFLDHAGRAPSPAGRLVLTTARPSLLDRAPHWCDEWSDSAPTVVDLAPLAPGDCCELVQALVGDALPVPLVEEVARRSDGNPLFTEELLRTWASVGVLEWVEGAWLLTTAADTVELPTTVEAIYNSQIDHLPSAARLVLQHAAVIGRRFPRSALEALELPEVEEGLSVLRRRALVVGPEDDPRWGTTYVFRHALLRDVGYEMLPRRDRALLHRRCAGWLEREGNDLDELAEAIGRHYAEAVAEAPEVTREPVVDDDTSRVAATWLERGGDHAWRTGAHDSACELFRDALGLTPSDAELDRARRLVRLGEATASAADMDEGIGAVEEALAEYRRLLPQPEARTGCAAAAAALGALWIEQVRFADAAALAEQTVREIGEADDEETARLLLLQESARYALAQDLESAGAEASTRAHDIASRLHSGTLELDSVAWLLPTFSFDRRNLAGLDWGHLERIARRERRWRTLVQLLQSRASLSIDDDATDALRLLDAADEIAEAHVFTESLAWSDYLRAEVKLLAGDWDAAVEAAHSVVAAGTANAYHRVVLRAMLVLAEIGDERDDADLLKAVRAWWLPTRERVLYTTNLLSRVMFPALDLRLHRHGLLPAPPPCQHVARPALVTTVCPSWYASAYLLIVHWIEQGDRVAARTGVDTLKAVKAKSRFGSAFCQLAAARVAEADGEQARLAMAALTGFRACGAPWWTLEALRVLDRLGTAPPAAAEDAAAIERALLTSAGAPADS